MNAVDLIDLDSVEATDPARVGAKAATLARLRQAGIAGIDVPPGVVSAASSAAAPRPQISPSSSTSADPESARALARAVIERLGDRPIAVRSSAVAEDTAEASYAGLYETALNVVGVEAIAEAILSCRASARSSLVADYRGETAAEPAILFQTMVDPVAAGVAFTADPITGERDAIRVSAVEGLGERLVSGEATPDEWSVSGGGARRLPGAGERALDEAGALAVAEAARRVAEALDGPQDVEWALAADGIAILQARPITVLPTPPREALEGVGWQKDEAHFPEPISPFGADVYLPSVVVGLEAARDRFGLLPEGFEQRAIGGEVYMRMLPEAKRAAPPAAVLGLLARVLPPLRRKVKAAREALEAGLLEEYPRRWEREWRAQLADEIAALRDVALEPLPDSELIEHRRAAEDLLRRGQRIHFLLFIPYAVAVFEFHRACEELLGWDEGRVGEFLVSRSPASDGGAGELAELRERIAAVPEATDRLREQASAPVDALGEVDAGLAAGLAEWIDRHGWRTANYDPGTPTLRERPALVTGLLLAEPATAPVEGAGAPARLELEAARERLDAAERRRLDDAIAAIERTYHQREENVILTDNVPCGLLRRWLLEAGRRLLERGAIDRIDDAAWLTAAELDRGLAGELGDGSAARESIARRRGEWAWTRAHPGPKFVGEVFDPPDISKIPAPARRPNEALLWIATKEFPEPPDTDGKLAEGAGGGSAGRELRGVAGSPGTYRGRARIVRGVAEFERLGQGEVLVCPVTAPAWTVLFPLAGALVTDTGGTLSHAAIIAREHGIPAVLGTGSATRSLRDGDPVEVDGAAGRVRILAGEPPSGSPPESSHQPLQEVN